MQIVYTVLSFLAAIIILVSVHEFGHFYVARLCGVRVLRFSLGFGKILWSRYDRHGTEFSVSAIPLGGYVKMLDEREAEVPSEFMHQTFNCKPIWQRMAIVLGGPIANFILAIFLVWMLLLQGEKGLIPVIGKIAPESIAAKAGLEVGQEIVAVDAQLTPTEQELEKQLLVRLGESGNINFTVRYPHSNLQYEIQGKLNGWMRGEKDPDLLKGLGIELAMPLKPIVGEVVAKSPAENAGFQVGDKILSVNGVNITDWSEWFDYVHARPAQLLSVSLDRSGKLLSLTVTPESFSEKGVSYGRVGMKCQPPADELFKQYEYSLGGALLISLEKTWGGAGFVLLSVKKLILGEISTKNLSGPISIAKVAGFSAQNGFKAFVSFLAFLSVSLGVFNLLPIPVLDGGHLVYLSLEGIKGKPVSERLQVLGFQLGLALVISLSMLAMYNDIMRL